MRRRYQQRRRMLTKLHNQQHPLISLHPPPLCSRQARAFSTSFCAVAISLAASAQVAPSQYTTARSAKSCHMAYHSSRKSSTAPPTQSAKRLHAPTGAGVPSRRFAHLGPQRSTTTVAAAMNLCPNQEPDGCSSPPRTCRQTVMAVPTPLTLCKSAMPIPFRSVLPSSLLARADPFAASFAEDPPMA